MITPRHEARVFSESAELYDSIYQSFKDYAAEAARVAELVRSIQPNARTVLDVGCGTGEHAKHLRATHGLVVDGLDLDPRMLAVARAKVPDAEWFEADMSRFALGRTYDVVLCLFSAIGYLSSLDQVTAALECFRQHLSADGTVIVEPWFAPGGLRVGTIDVKRSEGNGVRVERTGRVMIEGRLSRAVFEYRIESAAGQRQTEEVHELWLFTPDELLACFAAAGLAARYDPDGLTGRGLYLARRTEHPPCDG